MREGGREGGDRAAVICDCGIRWRDDAPGAVAATRMLRPRSFRRRGYCPHACCDEAAQYQYQRSSIILLTSQYQLRQHRPPHLVLCPWPGHTGGSLVGRCAAAHNTRCDGRSSGRPSGRPCAAHGTPGVGVRGPALSRRCGAIATSTLRYSMLEYCCIFDAVAQLQRHGVAGSSLVASTRPLSRRCGAIATPTLRCNTLRYCCIFDAVALLRRHGVAGSSL